MKNPNIAFRLGRQKLKHVETIQEKIKLLEELVSLNPKHPNDLRLKAKFKEELELLRKKIPKKKQQSKNLYDSINYNRQVVIVGETNSGKTTLMQKLTGNNMIISEAPFTTYKPEVGMFVYNDVPIQFIEVPSLYTGDNDRNKINFIRNSDIICVAVRNENELKSVVSTLEDFLVIISGEVSESQNHKYRPKDEVIEKPSFIAAWTKFDYEMCNLVDINLPADIGEEVYKLLNIMRIYCFKNGKVDGDPVIFPRNQEVTVEDFSKKLGLSRVKRAKIFGGSKTYRGQMVSLDYKLNDGEKVDLRC